MARPFPAEEVLAAALSLAAARAWADAFPEDPGGSAQADMAADSFQGRLDDYVRAVAQ